MFIRSASLNVRALLKVQHEVAYDFDPKVGWVRRLASEEEVGNLVTDAGRVAIHTYIYGTSAQRTSGGLSGTGFNYVAISDDATAPAAGDTTLTGELSGDGLDRAQGTVTLPTGSGTITTVENIFTYSGITQTVQKTALFDAASVGKMAHEILFTQRTLNNADTLTLQFFITLA
jgi:hypothetical protein